MTKNKKLLIALLSATFLTAGACGIAACKHDDDKKDPPPPTYAYNVTAKDGNGDPVKDVWFKVGYVKDDGTYEFVPVTHTVDGKEVPLVAKTGADGKTGFNFDAEDGKTYRVQLADVDEITTEGVTKNFPYGYRVVDEYVEFSDNKTSVEYNFSYYPNGFYENEHKHLNYKRTYDETANVPKEVKGENKYSLEKNRLSYFTLQTYDAPRDIEGADNDERRALYTEAAAGVYEVSFSTTSAAHVTMYNFAASEAYCYVDETDRKPHESIVIDTVTTANSAITVELTIYGDYSRAAQFFAIYADAACDVTINVTRTGDATEPDEIPTETAPFTAPTTAFENNPDGKLVLMPLNGTLSVEKGGDGYYHVGSENGPLLLVNLTKKLPRVGESSIAQLPINSETGENTFVKPVSENGNIVKRVKYNELVGAYADKVNRDGVYPVNDDLYTFLHEFDSLWFSSTISEYDWLIPCQYYAPEGGFEAKGEGTEASPFVILEGPTRLPNSNTSAWVSFTATATGLYSFTPASGTFTAPSNVATTSFEGVLYVALSAGETVKMQLNGASANTSVTTATASMLEATSKEVPDGNGGTSIEPGPGTSANQPLTLLQPGLYAYVKDDILSENGLFVKIPALVDGTYTLKVYGEGTGIIYNGETVTELTLPVVGGTDYDLVLTANEAGIYMLDVKFAAEGAGYSFTLDFDGMDSPTAFDFTTDEDGWYKFKLPEDSPIFSITLVDGNKSLAVDFDDNGDLVSVSFYAEAGVPVEFDILSFDAGTYSFSIVEGEAPELPAVGKTVEITAPCEFDLELTAGTYEIEISGGLFEIAQNQFVFTVGEDADAPQLTLGQGTYTGDITVSADGTYKVTVAVPNAYTGSVNIELTITAK